MKYETPKKDVLLDYTFVLDASGSMSGEISEVLDELNRQLKDLKVKWLDTSRPCRVTIVKFDTDYVVLRDHEYIQDVNLITEDEYYAGGMTSLYDAIGLSVKRADARIDFQVRRGNAEALVVVFTDGGREQFERVQRIGHPIPSSRLPRTRRLGDCLDRNRYECHHGYGTQKHAPR